MRNLSASMSFAEASDVFLEGLAPINSRRRIQYVSERTLYDTGRYLHTLGKFFRELRLSDIHPGHLRTYQELRANGDPSFAFQRGKGERAKTVTVCVGAEKINDELGVLKRLMVAASAWTPELAAHYRELDEPDSDMPRALSIEEQRHWLRVTSQNPAHQLMWWYSLVALHTAFSSDEMRTIRQGDIHLHPSYALLGVNVKYGKNRFRRREIPLTDPDCLWALERLLERAGKLGGLGPSLHLFPRRLVRDHYDGTLPVSESGLRKPFEAARDEAGLPWFKLNGFRHTAITRMAEAGVAIAVMMKRAGHVSPKMTAHYTHISEQVERSEMLRMQAMQQRKPVASVRPLPMPSTQWQGVYRA